jgi:hypothetical protein
VTSGAIVDTLCDVNFGDGGGGRWIGVTGGAAAAFADPLNIRGLFVVPNGSDGSACWMRQSGGFFTGNISDDSALVVPVPRRIGQSTGSVYSAHGMLYVVSASSLSATPNISRGGLFMYDLGSTPIYNQIYLGASCGVATAGTVLTGTTGTDGIITLSFAAETLYVENRTGVSAPVFLNFFAGH